MMQIFSGPDLVMKPVIEKEKAMTRVFHTSPEKITEIYNNPVFGDVLFFADTPYYRQGHSEYVYALDLDDDKIIDVDRFFYHEDYEKLSSLVKKIQNYFDVDEDTAEDLLSGKLSTYGVVEDGEKAGSGDWWLQGLQGEAAKILGYDAACGADENGAVYIVPMTGKFDRLTDKTDCSRSELFEDE